MLLFVALLATWTSCSKSDDIEANDPKPVNPTPTNPTDKTDPTDDPYMVVCEHAAEVANKVSDFYDKSETLTDMEKYIGDIKKIEYVEDAYVSGYEMFVKIKDYGKMSYSFFPQPLSEQNSKAHIIVKRNRKLLTQNFYSAHPILKTPKIAFVSQTQNDESWDYTNEWINNTLIMYSAYPDFSVEPTVIEPDVAFFQEGIFDYDLVLLVTHGNYDSESKLHSFLTSESVKISETRLNAKHFIKYKGVPTDEVYYTFHREKRYGIKIPILYAVVTEKWIKHSPKDFVNKGKAVVFNAACNSMQGPVPNTEDSVSYSVSKIFYKKGAAAYFGYDETAWDGTYAGLIFMNRLLSGESIENAYKDIPFNLAHNYRDKDGDHLSNYWSDLIEAYNPQFPSIKQSRLYNSFHISYDDTSSDDELIISLNANTTYLNDMYITYNNDKQHKFDWLKVFPKNSPIYYGFYLSRTSNLKDAEQVCLLTEGSEGFSYEAPLVSFNYTLTYKPLVHGCMIEPETTYYYWAYFYDGHDYYLSDMDSFTTGSLKDTGNSGTNTSGQGNLPNVPGSDF